MSDHLLSHDEVMLIRTDQFSQAWSIWPGGREPDIDDFLSDLPEPWRGRLFGWLLQEDVRYRGYHQLLHSTEVYAKRFPEYSAAIQQLAPEPRQMPDRSEAATPPCGPYGTDTHIDQLLPSIPGYELLNELGRGGMGVVYRARQIKLNRIVAIKMVHGEILTDPRAALRFLGEAEAVAAIKHPNVVQVYEFGESGGQPFLAMEYLAGGSLSERLQAIGTLTPKNATEVVEKVSRGIQAAHDVGVVHRDLKPSNVLFDEAGEPKVTDFGIAKRGPGVDLTTPGVILGSPAYMSPEQAKGDTKFTGPATDIYAVGVILYECLTNHVPFEAPDAMSLLVKVATDDPPPPTRFVPDVPGDLELICQTCLAKNPRERYPTAAALADDLRRWAAGELVTVRPPSLLSVLRAWGRKNFGQFGWTFPIGLATGGMTGLMIWLAVLSWVPVGAIAAIIPSYGGSVMARIMLFEPPKWLAVGTFVISVVIIPCVGLLTARLVRTRSRDADIAAGLVVGLVAAVGCFCTGAGCVSYLYGLGSTIIGGEPSDEELLTQAAFRNPGPVHDSSLDQSTTSAEEQLLVRYPNLRGRTPEARAILIQLKLILDQLSRVQAAIWCGLITSLLVFLPLCVISTVTGGRLLRDTATDRGWQLTLFGYCERTIPLLLLLLLIAGNILGFLMGSNAMPMSAWIGAFMVGTALLLTLVAVYRQLWWPIRLILHLSWIFSPAWALSFAAAIQ